MKILQYVSQKIFLIILTYTILLILCDFQSYGLIYIIPPEKRLIGENIKITIPKNNTLPLEYFAEKFQTGISNLLEANPNIDVYLPQSGQEIIIPHQLILPDTPRNGIIINSAEMRLYFYPKNSNKIIIFPIGIGQFGKNTPFNWITSVKRKKNNPTWTPTKSIRDEYILKGENLPKTMPPGPKNPMGLHALYIGKLYAIHGTNTNFGIGLRVSHGCVRLRNQDMKYLFEHVPIGTKVQFINEPVKITKTNGIYYMEVHHPLSITEKEFSSNQPITIQLSNSMKKMLNNKNINTNIVHQVLQDRQGIPKNITLVK